MKLLAILLALTAYGQQPKQPNPAFAPVEEVAGLPRVLLIGDSISIGYTLPTRELLKGKANLLRIPTNAATTKVTLEHIDEWLGDKKWDVIHCNWGLHDLKIMEDGKHQVSLEDYEKNLNLLITRLKKTGAKVIFANTTPVPEGKVNPLRNPADVPRFNAVAARVMKKHKVKVNDLYSAMVPKAAELQLPVNVHFTDAGYRFLAEHVAAEISRALK
jgi:acyl-CoA thioesterase-1